MRIRILVWSVILLTMNTLLAENPVRVATFNIKELSTAKLTELDENGIGRNEQVRAAAAVVQAVRPDILVLNEIDHDYSGGTPNYLINAKRFVRAYLNRGDTAIDYPYVYAAPCNTGIPTDVDLNGDGYRAIDSEPPSPQYAADCYGWGEYPGQYSMAIVSKYPIRSGEARTFQRFLWKDLPNHHLPETYYSPEAIEILRLSSKSHWDVPVQIGEQTLHLWVSHPTPPGFDGDDDRNGRRNFDEIQFWMHYLNNRPELVDDQGNRGGYRHTAPFIIAGDLNASPKNDAVYDSITAIDQLLQHPNINNTTELQTSRGVVELTGEPDSKKSTAYFGPGRDMQIDYVLPSNTLPVEGGGVYWPAESKDPAGFAIATLASDHRLVWLDILLR